MTATNHYRDQIGRAMERLAQLQAKEVLANQRREAKAQETAKREELKRRQRVADLVFLAGAHALEDAELVGALLEHAACRNDQNMRELIHAKGSERLKSHWPKPPAEFSNPFRPPSRQSQHITKKCDAISPGGKPASWGDENLTALPPSP